MKSCLKQLGDLGIRSLPKNADTSFFCLPFPSARPIPEQKTKNKTTKDFRQMPGLK